MSLGEGAFQRSSAVSAGTKGHKLTVVAHLGPAAVIGALEVRRIDEQVFCRRFPGERGDCHVVLLSSLWATLVLARCSCQQSAGVRAERPFIFFSWHSI